MSSQNSIKFLHLIDHNGTIFKLIHPLSIYPEHKILTSFSSSHLNKTMRYIKKVSKQEDINLILHATGNNKIFYNMKEELIKQFKRVYIFLHVSPKHFLIKHRQNELQLIKKLSLKKNVGILTPSKTLKKEFLQYGIKTSSIQIGIGPINKAGLDKKKKKFISTICTSNKKSYRYIKGIDLFSEAVEELGLKKESIILGDDSGMFNGIKTKKVSQNKFLRYIEESKVYLQLSRTESYNLSAVYAKQLKIPLIVSDIEGHKDNVKYGFRVKNIEQTKKYIKKILINSQDDEIKKSVEKNYVDSIKRESLENFKKSFDNLLRKRE